jgi:hypothetical protein
MFTTLLALFNATQGDKERLHELSARFKSHVSALSQSSVAIPPILQAMLFLQTLHSHYQDLLAQFTSKQKDLSSMMIDSVVADAKFMDKFIVVGIKLKSGNPGALRLPLHLSLIRMARSITLPGSGLLSLTQLPWSPAGIDLSLFLL